MVIHTLVNATSSMRHNEANLDDFFPKILLSKNTEKNSKGIVTDFASR